MDKNRFNHDVRPTINAIAMTKHYAAAEIANLLAATNRACNQQASSATLTGIKLNAVKAAHNMATMPLES